MSIEVRVWRRRAACSPDTALRIDALHALTSKRANIDGAALFWSVPRRRDHDLLRLLVAYEIAADFLDCTSERGAYVGVHNGRQLHRALLDALNPPATSGTDHYRFHPWQDDGDYLLALVDACRERYTRLPSKKSARALTIRAAQLAQVLALNHEPNPNRRDAHLTRWAENNLCEAKHLVWFERSAAASAWLTILALFALTAEPDCEPSRARATYAAYLPWVCVVGTMLDSYSDAPEDTAGDAHSYISHYPTIEVATARVAGLLDNCITAVQRLPDGNRHAVIVACMVAMYLTKDSSRAPHMREHTRKIARSGGPATRMLMPALRLWRLLYRLRTA